MVRFLENLLAEGSAPGTFDAVLRHPTRMSCTKLETLYHAAHASRWGATGFASDADVSTCRGFLEALAAWEGAAEAGAVSVRQLLPFETVEFVVQLLGDVLSGDGAARPVDAAAPLSQVRIALVLVMIGALLFAVLFARHGRSTRPPRSRRCLSILRCIVVTVGL